MIPVKDIEPLGSMVDMISYCVYWGRVGHINISHSRLSTGDMECWKSHFILMSTYSKALIVSHLQWELVAQYSLKRHFSPKFSCSHHTCKHLYSATSLPLLYLYHINIFLLFMFYFLDCSQTQACWHLTLPISIIQENTPSIDISCSPVICK